MAFSFRKVKQNETNLLWAGLPRCKNLWHFFFVFLARAGVWVLFNGLSALLFSLFDVIREFDKFLHRGWALWAHGGAKHAIPR